MNENTEILFPETETAVPETETPAVYGVEDTETVDAVPVTGAAITVNIPSETVATVINDIHLTAVFTILVFCKSCLRSWREHTVKTTRG